MPTADTLIQRDGGGHQQPAAGQVWVIQARSGTTFNVGFDKEFVKKHLFVDPDPIASAHALGVKAAKIAGNINLYGNLAGPAQQALPPVLDASVLRFLKLKKLVLSRVSQGSCATCNQKESVHQTCTVCNHKHKKIWEAGLCAEGPKGGTLCTCTTWAPATRKHAGCAGFVDGHYDQHRNALGLPNPFAGPGGACTGDNTVVLMNEIDLQDFKDAVVGAIQAQGVWNDFQRKEGLELNFGVGTSATIKSVDSLDDFNGRAKGKGIKVDAKRNGGTYIIYHYRDMIA
ncbi:hypothetical protein [Sandaracinobacteroides saxicola]|uniref:Uncharacterized protein n=1 Tax=Sandaracinobacteroides saxicola TaxID=2759707 RepID=A0A7G5IKQ9_9SPHN|nr:hypothetical protein [Sandaracinobacteroides saxicola]QMW23951.1 hypothetical protein H3309_05640 [Sandaracinobacteroides saxicola]